MSPMFLPAPALLINLMRESLMSVLETQTQLLADLQVVCMRLGRAPSSGEYRENGLKSPSYYIYHFGTLKESLRQVGFKPNPTGKRFDNGRRGPNGRYSTRQLLQHVRKVAKKVGRTPTQKDLIAHGPPYPGTLVKPFEGRMPLLMAAANLVPRLSPKEGTYTDEALIDHLKLIEWEVGRKPTFMDVKRRKPPTVYTGIKRFGSFDKWLLAAGYTIRRAQRGTDEQSSNQD